MKNVENSRKTATMSKMTKEELQKRKTELKRIVHADIVKREVMQFRLEPENIDKVYRIAAKKRKPAGTLLREWITDRINTELQSEKSRLARIDAVSSLNLDLALDRLKSELERPLKEINKRICVVEDIAHRLEQSQNK